MKTIDYFNEIDSNLENILLNMNLNTNKKLNFNYLNENIKKLNQDKNIVFTNNYQEMLRVQEELFNNGIRLVGIDISRTIIEYKSNNLTQKNAAKILKNKYNNIFADYSIEQIIKMFSLGFKKYNNRRKYIKTELNEIYVYKKYILNKIYKKNKSLMDNFIIEDIIEIWMKNSVNISLNATKIKEIINELKNRNLIVVSISDMLGNMSKYALKYFDIYHLFDAHFCSNDFKYRKNHKKSSLYKSVLKYYKIKPKNCLMIGNDLIDDVKSSIKNGWKSIYVTYSNNNVFFKNNIANIFKLDDLYKLLKLDKIEELPLLKDEMNLFNNEAKRNNDKDEYIRKAYYVRQKVKRISNRELREKLYKNYLIKNCGSSTRLGNNIEIRIPFNIVIGDNCQINDNLTILNENFVFIGNNVMIANNVFISTYFHSWKRGMLQDTVESWKKGNTKTKCVSIEDNCWVGPNSCFEAGVFLGHHSVVCANSLVKSGTYPPYSLIGGNPAKILKNIENELYVESKVM